MTHQTQGEATMYHIEYRAFYPTHLIVLIGIYFSKFIIYMYTLSTYQLLEEKTRNELNIFY